MVQNISQVLENSRSISGLVVLRGRPGSGKTTLMKELVAQYNGMKLPDSFRILPIDKPELSLRIARMVTTRDPKPGDDTEEGTCVTEERFDQMIEGGELKLYYESRENGKRYGWLQGELHPKDRNEIVFTTTKDPDVRDLEQLLGAVSVYLDVQTCVLEDRIRVRGGNSVMVQERLNRLTQNRSVTVLDATGQIRDSTPEDEFLGTYAPLGGISHLIVENNGDVGLTAETIFPQILELVQQGKKLFSIPAQRNLIFDGKTCQYETLRPKDRLRPSGLTVNHPEQVDYGKFNLPYLVMLGVVHRPWKSGLPSYIVRVSEIGKEIDLWNERKVAFRGGIIHPMEYWCVDSENLREFIDHMYANGFDEPVLYTSDETSTGDLDRSKCTYCETSSQYRDIMQIFEDFGLQRIFLPETMYEKLNKVYQRAIYGIPFSSAAAMYTNCDLQPPKGFGLNCFDQLQELRDLLSEEEIQFTYIRDSIRGRHCALLIGAGSELYYVDTYLLGVTPINLEDVFQAPYKTHEFHAYPIKEDHAVIEMEYRPDENQLKVTKKWSKNWEPREYLFDLDSQSNDPLSPDLYRTLTLERVAERQGVSMRVLMNDGSLYHVGCLFELDKKPSTKGLFIREEMGKKIRFGSDEFDLKLEQIAGAVHATPDEMIDYLFTSIGLYQSLINE
ncbi:hypothetical protein JXB41_01055 [Candidatus Woesearchaeota archaeon]|nr:hypothetical protein [Candidatus Woesearchaeota archaeon]